MSTRHNIVLLQTTVQIYMAWTSALWCAAAWQSGASLITICQIQDYRTATARDVAQVQDVAQKKVYRPGCLLTITVNQGTSPCYQEIPCYIPCCPSRSTRSQ